MRAIAFDGAIPRYLATKGAGLISSRLLTGSGRCTYLAEVDEPALPGPGWARMRTRLGGICGSDLNMVRLSVSPSTSPFSSFPFVIGHENVGVVTELGPEARGVRVGDRVVANPLLGCVARGIDPPCRHCATGYVSRCENFTEGSLAPGMMLGTTRGLGGSWGESYVAPARQLFRIPDALSDRAALLLEPFAAVISPLLEHPLPEEGKALVVGAGPIGLLATAAVKALAPAMEVTALVRYPFQAEWAERLGADHCVVTRGQGDYFAELARLSDGRLLQPILGKRIQIGGFTASLVCVGGDTAVEDALRFTGGGGSIYMLGNVARLPKVDWTPLWLKEISIHGSVCYNEHTHGGASTHAFSVGVEIMSSGWSEKLSGLVTHTYPLTQYEAALQTCFHRTRDHSLKVAFEFEG